MESKRQDRVSATEPADGSRATSAPLTQTSATPADPVPRPPPAPIDSTRTREPTEDPGALSVHMPAATTLRDPKRYRILGEHGRGGLGRVSRVHDVELGRDIAIKELISRGHVSEVRFLREALVTARLEHPGIVPVYEAGGWPDGTPFYAMKLVAGRSLRELISDRRTVDERLALLHHVIAVADAIAYAHGRNIIHRDLKPSNIIVGDFGETVVIDWGLAKDLTASEETPVSGGPPRTQLDDGLTSAGTILGTPAYMAPEQERGEHVDQRADVFAIGAMLWELCSLERLPPRYSGQRCRILRRAGIDQDLTSIIDKALDPDPARRYENARALATDLKAFKAGARIAARRYSLIARLVHWTRRHRTFALSVIGGVVLAAIGLALYVRNIAVERDRVDAALGRVEKANDALTLEHAELLLQSDPTAAFATLSTYRGDDDSRLHRLIAEAKGRGIATMAITPHSDTIWFLRGGDTDEILSLGEDSRILLSRGATSRTIADDASTGVVWDYASSTRLLAYATSPSGVALLHVTTRTPLRISAIRPRVLRFSPNGSHLAALSNHGELIVWSLASMGEQLLYRKSFPGALRLRFMTETRVVIQDSVGLHTIALDSIDGAHRTSLRSDISAYDTRSDAVALGTLTGNLEIMSPELEVLSKVSLCQKGVVSLWFVPHRNRITFSCQDGYSGLLNHKPPAPPEIIARFPTQGLTIVNIDAEGRYITALDQSHTSYIYDLETQLIHRYAGSPGRPTYVSPPTREFPHVLTGDANGAIRMWRPPETSAHVVMQGPAPLFGIAFAPDSKSIITSGVERIARYVQVDRGATVELRGHTGGIRGSRISPDGASMLTYSYDGTVRVWRTSDRSTIREFRGHGSPVEDAQYVEGGKRIVSVGDDGRLLAWTPDGTDMSVIFQQPIPLTRIQVLSHNGHIVVRDIKGSVWDVVIDGAARQVQLGGEDDVTILRAAPDGSFVAVGTSKGHVAIYSTVDWHAVVTFETGSGIRQVAFDPFGRDVLIASEPGRSQSGHIDLVPLNARRNRHWRQVTAAVRNVAYAPDGETLGFVCDDGSTWLYSIRDDVWAYSNDHYTDTLTAVFSPDGRLFASSDRQGVLVVRDVSSSFRAVSQNISSRLNHEKQQE